MTLFIFLSHITTLPHTHILSIKYNMCDSHRATDFVFIFMHDLIAVEFKDEISRELADLRHERLVAIENKVRVSVKKLDLQIDKLEALEKLQKEKHIAWEQLERGKSDDYEGAVKLREKLEHVQAEYDAEYKSV